MVTDLAFNQETVVEWGHYALICSNVYSMCAWYTKQIGIGNIPSLVRRKFLIPDCIDSYYLWIPYEQQAKHVTVGTCL